MLTSCKSHHEEDSTQGSGNGTDAQHDDYCGDRGGCGGSDGGCAVAAADGDTDGDDVANIDSY